MRRRKGAAACKMLGHRTRLKLRPPRATLASSTAATAATSFVAALLVGLALAASVASSRQQATDFVSDLRSSSSRARPNTTNAPNELLAFPVNEAFPQDEARASLERHFALRAAPASRRQDSRGANAGGQSAQVSRAPLPPIGGERLSPLARSRHSRRASQVEQQLGFANATTGKFELSLLLRSTSLSLAERAVVHLASARQVSSNRRTSARHLRAQKQKFFTKLRQKEGGGRLVALVLSS